MIRLNILLPFFLLTILAMLLVAYFAWGIAGVVAVAVLSTLLSFT